MRSLIINLLLFFLLFTANLFSSTVTKPVTTADFFSVNFVVDIYLKEWVNDFENPFSRNLVEMLNNQNHLTDYDFYFSPSVFRLKLRYNFSDMDVFTRWSDKDSLEIVVQYLRRHTESNPETNTSLSIKKTAMPSDILTIHNLTQIDSLNIPVNFYLRINKKCDNTESKQILLQLLQEIDIVGQKISLGYDVVLSGFNVGINFEFEDKHEFTRWYQSTSTTKFIDWLNSLITDKEDRIDQELYFNFKKMHE
ncbi:hypothetical protein EH221_07355 [bacterium]|nr:MAG: hypothetical protein EH221_07355 [bacterium]